MRTPLVPVEIVVPVYPLCACGRGSVVSPLAHICKLCEQEAKRAAARISMARRRAAAARAKAKARTRTSQRRKPV